jgi:hypothetical protein
VSECVYAGGLSCIILARADFRQGHGNEIHTNTVAVIQASTRTFFGMLGRTIVHASRFSGKFDFGTRCGITLVHSW